MPSLRIIESVHLIAQETHGNQDKFNIEELDFSECEK